MADVLHVFQKKASKGTATPKVDLDLVRRRLKSAERHYDENYRRGKDKENRNA